MLVKLTDKMREMIGNDDCKSRNDYLLGEIINGSKNLGIAGIKGTVDNYGAVNEFAKNIFKAEETQSIIGKI